MRSILICVEFRKPFGKGIESGKRGNGRRGDLKAALLTLQRPASFTSAYTECTAQKISYFMHRTSEEVSRLAPWKTYEVGKLEERTKYLPEYGFTPV